MTAFFYLVSTAATLLSIKIAHYFLVHPLRSVPGPILAPFIGFAGLIAINCKVEDMHIYVNELHQRYGSIVRIGRNELLFGSPKSLKALHTSPAFARSDQYEVFLYKGDRFNLLTTPSNDEHAFFRKLVSPAFSVAYIDKMECLIKDVMMSVFKKIDGGDGVVDVWKTSAAFAFDVIGTTAFGSSFQMVENGSHEVVTCLTESLSFMMVKMVFPAFLLPLFPMHKKTIDGNDKTVAFLRKIIAERELSKKKRVDLLQMLMDNKDVEGDGTGLSDINIINHAMLFLAAGSETTSNSMAFFLIRIVRDQKYLPRILQELDECPVDENGLIEYKSLKDLMWLDAVIKETMRIMPIVPGPIFRQALEDCVVDGVSVPKGAICGSALLYVSGRHEGWVDGEVFRPERFLDAKQGSKTEEQAAIDQAARDNFFIPFSLGPKNCIGKNFALMEMKVFLGNMLKRYAIEDIAGQSIESSLHITLQLNSGCYNVNVKRRE